MATLTIRQLDEMLVNRIKARAAQSGRSMEEEVRSLLDRTYGDSEQLARQRKWAKRLQRLRAERRLPKSTVESSELIHELREERTQQILDTLSRPQRDADR